MNEVYEKIIAARHDTTRWLLHFTHDQREHGEGFDWTDTPARDILVSILCDGFLKPNWSRRSGKSTVYGPRPAVCFTEMPLLAFVEYLNARDDTLSISGYGVVLNKKQVFAEGGRPAIYDSDLIELQPKDNEYDQKYRLVDPEQYPYDLQHRLVLTYYGEDKTVDWTHEREWRWPQQDHQGRDKLWLTGSGWLGTPRSAGHPHVFVLRDKDITWLQREVSTRLKEPDDASDRRERDYLECARARSGIISLETVEREVSMGDRRYARLETWPSDEPVALLGSPGQTKTAGELFVHPY